MGLEWDEVLRQAGENLALVAIWGFGLETEVEVVLEQMGNTRMG